MIFLRGTDVRVSLKNAESEKKNFTKHVLKDHKIENTNQILSKLSKNDHLIHQRINPNKAGLSPFILQEKLI